MPLSCRYLNHWAGGVGRIVGVGVNVGTAVAVGVGFRVGVTTGLHVAVAVGFRVGVTAGLQVAVAVGFRVGVFVNVGLSVKAGVRMGVAVGFWDGFTVGVRLGEGDMVIPSANKSFWFVVVTGEFHQIRLNPPANSSATPSVRYVSHPCEYFIQLTSQVCGVGQIEFWHHAPGGVSGVFHV